jgi:hypothetical protein
MWLAGRGLVHAPDHRGREVRSEVRKVQLKTSPILYFSGLRSMGLPGLIASEISPRMRNLYDWVFSLPSRKPGRRTLDVREYVGF